MDKIQKTRAHTRLEEQTEARRTTTNGVDGMKNKLNLIFSLTFILLYPLAYLITLMWSLFWGIFFYLIATWWLVWNLSVFIVTNTTTEEACRNPLYDLFDGVSCVGVAIFTASTGGVLGVLLSLLLVLLGGSYITDALSKVSIKNPRQEELHEM